ncbi:macrolide family glycosyltransferase [Streptomyces sp. NPDC026672]|uniref:macrolide family glycosyltransferase n=1 Tax=unclassified Streptomyces TaxID=2593676 RepID=UPI0034084C1A
MQHRTDDPHPLHCAILTFADFGHVAPSLGVARELIARGHRVTYVVDERFAPLVEQAGAAVVPYASARGDFYRAADPSPEQLAQDGYELLVDTVRTVFPAARAALDGDRPDVVLYDFESVAVGRVAAHLWDALPVQVCPSHAANESFSLRAQMWDREYPVMAEGARVFVEFLGEHGIGLEQMGRYGTEWDEHNLVFLPRDFQIEGDSFDERFAFVGPTVAEAGAGLWSPPADGRRTALVSLGTESGDREFFRTCAQAFDADGWQVVMTLGRGADRSALEPLPAHVEVHEWLPHPAVLPHADVLVCHAGMGSLMEALYFGTPVVAIPRAHELGLSARRLEELGVGRSVPRPGLDAETLSRTVTDLLADPRTPAGLERMRKAVREAGGAVRAADLVENWAAQSRRPETSGSTA